MVDEADIYEGVRAQFPFSFGKQSKFQTPLELVHNAARRTTGASATSTAANDKPFASKKTDAFSSLSSSSQDWISSFKNSNPRKSSRDSNVGTLVGPPRPPAALGEEDEKMIGPPPGRGGSGDGDEEHLIGSPRPPLGKAEDDDGPTIGPPRPPPGKAEDDDDADAAMIGQPRPPPGALDSDSDSDSDEGEDVDEEDEDAGYRVPLSNEIVFKGPTKVVSALAVDHTGSRVLSGSYDYTVRMYDFQGMNSHLQSFRQLEPFEGHQIRGLSWSSTAD